VWEVGTAAGGTLWALAQVCPLTEIVSIDLVNGVEEEKRLRELIPGVELVRGDSRTVLLPRRRPDFVLIDADHTYDGVRADWERYWPLVRPGGVCALHDVLMHTDPVHQTMAVDTLWGELVLDPDLVTVQLSDTSPASASWSLGDWGGVAWGGFGVVFKQ